MEFGSPTYLNALYALPLIALLFFYGTRQRGKELLRFSGAQLAGRLAPGRSWRKNLLKSTLKTTGVALLILALARPQFGTQLVKVEREGIDLVIALDVSLSMLAEDMKPNRLDRAKQEIVDFIGGLKGDRVGVVAFAGDAFVLCPLTVDYNAALLFAQSADVDIASKQGTAIDKAIETSMTLFRESSHRDRVIVLVTDGESHEGDPTKVAREAAEERIRIYTIGIGNPSGELIPLRGTGGAVEGYKKDTSGETVLTRLDEGTLRSVAQVTGGKYLPATREGLELKVLYREISGMDKKTIEGEFVERKTDRFPVFLAFSFLLLGIEALVTRRGSSAASRRILHTGVKTAVALFLMFGLASPALAKRIDGGRVKSGNKYYGAGDYEKALILYKEALGDSTQQRRLAEGVLYNEGNALHMLERYPEALAKYHESLSEDSVQTGRMLYNRGGTLVKMNKIDEAIESYVQALRYLPDDADIRHNLELALKLREQQQQQQQQQQSNQGEKQEDKQQGEGEKSPQQRGDDSDKNDPKGQQDQQLPDSSQITQPSESDSTAMEPQEAQSIQLSREDAMRILRLLEEQEKELQKAKRKAAMKRVQQGKDW
jgi:Ca-activated chloride channel family protein